MNASAIEIRGLRKEFSRPFGKSTVAVDSLDLDVPAGGVFGFLGPNGAGKTTTIRCLLGLVTPTEGSVVLLGESIPDGLPGVIGRVGAMVESAKYFPGFSARVNLELLATKHGPSTRDLDEVLDEVGLLDRADDKFGTYSLGMKQRLAMAGALLKDPQLLVLDEPANGLDPAGIRDMRDLIQRHGAAGATVLVSSHQLAEVQVMCDNVAIINKGRLLVSGSVPDVLSTHGEYLIVTIDDVPGAVKTLSAAGFSASPGSELNTVIVEAGEESAAAVTQVLASDDRYLSGLRVESASLESAFLRLTGTLADPA